MLSKIQTEESVRKFMVKCVKRVLAIRIQPHDHVVFVLTRLIQARMMNVTFCLPFLGKKQSYCVLVSCRHDDNRLRGVHTHCGESAVKHVANLLELVRDLSRLLLASVSLDAEVRAPHRNRVVCGSGGVC